MVRFQLVEWLYKRGVVRDAHKMSISVEMNRLVEIVCKWDSGNPQDYELNKATKALNDEEREGLIKVSGLKPSSDKNVEARILERRLYGDYDEEDLILSELSA